MTVLIIPDKFKNSLSSQQVIHAMERGIRRSEIPVEITSVIASDGGDGFLNSIFRYIKNVKKIHTDTTDPLSRKTSAPYLYDKAGKKAYIELAKASGVELLSEDERNAMDSSTYGTGLQIKHAIGKGAESIYIGLGGSATNDGAMGIATALGYEFRDAENNLLRPSGRNLIKIHHILDHKVKRQVQNIAFYALNDVDNPLFGRNGAAFTYAKQKGATDDEVIALDSGLRQLHQTVKRQLKKDIATIAGSGAAGGTAYGLKTFFDAEFISGIDFILDISGVKQLLKKKPVDCIITGEGKIDQQTSRGKLIKGITELGQKYHIPVLAICGSLNLKKVHAKNMGLSEVVEIYDRSKPLQYSIDNASKLVENASCKLFRDRFL